MGLFTLCHVPDKFLYQIILKQLPDIIFHQLFLVVYSRLTLTLHVPEVNVLLMTYSSLIFCMRRLR